MRTDTRGWVAAGIGLLMSSGLAGWQAVARAADAASPHYDPPVGSRWSVVTEGREEKLQDGKATETTTFTRKEELSIVEKTETGYRVTAVQRGYDFHGGKAENGVAALLGALQDVVVR